MNTRLAPHQQAYRSVTQFLLAAVAILIASCNSDQLDTASDQSPSTTTLETNVWSAREVSESEIATIEKAYERYLVSKGWEPELIKEKRAGLTDEQILKIEEGICTRLPEDLKAFLGVYLTDSNFIGSIGFFKRPERFILSWKQKVELHYNITPIISSRTFTPLRYDPDCFDNESQFNGYLVQIAEDRHVDPLFIDIRTGHVVQEQNHTIFKRADSLADLLDEMTAQEESKIKGSEQEERAGRSDFE